MTEENTPVVQDGEAAPIEAVTESPVEETQEVVEKEPDKEAARENYQRRKEKRELEALKKTVAQLQEQLVKKDAPKPVEMPKRPLYQEYESDEAYNSAMDAYEEQRDLYKSQQLKKQEDQTKQKQTQEQLWADFEAKEQKFLEQTPDYEDVVHEFAQKIPLTPSNSQTFREIAARPDAAEILYNLAKDPKLAAQVFPDLPATKLDLIVAQIKKPQEHKPLPNPPTPSRATSGHKSDNELSGRELLKKHGII